MEVLAETTLAVILGAHQWPKKTSLAGNVSYLNSANAIKDYLLDETYFGLPQDNLLYLFDSPDNPSAITMAVGKFIKERAKFYEADEPIRDILLFYTGHGYFSEDGSEFYLALKATEQDFEEDTSLSIKSLANRLKRDARFLRRFVILDCCYSGQAAAAFQSQPDKHALRKILEAMPERGTAVFCSSNRKDPSVAPKDQPYTMFSGALRESLLAGEPNQWSRLTFEDLERMVWANICTHFGEDRAVRPELHCPDKSQGDLGVLPFFPNPAKTNEPGWIIKTVHQYGKLEISSSRGGTLFLDQSQVQVLGQHQKCFVSEVQAGDHVLRIEAAGFETIHESFHLKPEETRIFSFEPKSIEPSVSEEITDTTQGEAKNKELDLAFLLNQVDLRPESRPTQPIKAAKPKRQVLPDLSRQLKTHFPDLDFTITETTIPSSLIEEERLCLNGQKALGINAPLGQRAHVSGLSLRASNLDYSAYLSLLGQNEQGEEGDLSQRDLLRKVVQSGTEGKPCLLQLELDPKDFPQWQLGSRSTHSRKLGQQLLLGTPPEREGFSIEVGLLERPKSDAQ